MLPGRVQHLDTAAASDLPRLAWKCFVRIEKSLRIDGLGMSAHGVLRLMSFGRTPVKYGDALKLQELLAGQRKLQEIADTLIILQHQPVFTIGKRGRQEDFLISQEEIHLR